MPEPLWVAVDVHYPAGGGAVAALVASPAPAFDRIDVERVVELDHAEPYRPGEFARRELPPVRAVLATLDAPVAALVVDGYVHLDPDGRPGLGAHAHTELGVPVIGVAKTAFRSATHALPVLRGSATRPLHVTAAGLDPARAARLVRDMAGPHRMPDALRRVDALARGTGPRDTMKP